ncbi:hypothetical protein JCM17961_45340 [Endothiovibrio diazotrophicus]
MALAGCASSPPIHYYLLAAEGATTETTADGTRELTIGIEPVVLPGYLTRREMVSRRGDNALELAADHQWAEPLAENVARVVGEALGRGLASDRVVMLPIPRTLRQSLPLDYRVAITLHRFEVVDGRPALTARWVLLDPDKRERLRRRSEYVGEPVAAGDYAARAAAQSRLLERLSGEIAAAITGGMRRGQAGGGSGR